SADLFRVVAPCVLPCGAGAAALQRKSYAFLRCDDRVRSRACDARPANTGRPGLERPARSNISDASPACRRAFFHTTPETNAPGPVDDVLGYRRGDAPVGGLSSRAGGVRGLSTGPRLRAQYSGRAVARGGAVVRGGTARSTSCLSSVSATRPLASALVRSAHAFS